MTCHRFSGEGWAGIVCVDEGAVYDIDVGGKRLRFDWSERWGPSLTRKDGEISDRQPGPRHEFWRATSLWDRQGKRCVDGVALWDEPSPQVVRRIRGRHYEVVSFGSDPDYSRTVVLPPATPAAAVLAGEAGLTPLSATDHEQIQSSPETTR